MRSHVCVAVRKHDLLRIRSGGQAWLLEPYVHGWDADEREVVRGVRFREGPTEGGEPAWVTLALEDLEHLEPARRGFLVRRSYDPRDPGLPRVHCRVAP